MNEIVIKVLAQEIQRLEWAVEYKQKQIDELEEELRKAKTDDF